MFGTPGFRLIQSADELVQQGNPSLFLGYGALETTIYAWDLITQKWTRGLCFSFDPTFSSIPSHSFPTSYRNILGTLKLEEAKVLHMKICDKPCNPTANIKLTLPLLHKSSPLSVVIKDDESCNVSILHHVPPRYPWRNFIPTEQLSNSWMLAIDDEEPIMDQGE